MAAESSILGTHALGFVWDTLDPFLFCVHHADAFPAGNAELGPAASLAGRSIGQDFELRDGWRMYHGDRVPGFPAHPHRGFETVTVVTRGVVDHADSHGATGRYGEGDVQWMTAGRGLQHAEMFPLLREDAPNPAELFQIWLNLPRADKMSDPHYRMLWSEAIPRVVDADVDGRRTEVTVVAGRYAAHDAPAPAPDSWAADPAHEVAIWLLRMEPGARWTLPAASAAARRMLYLFEGEALEIDGVPVASGHGVELRADVAVPLHNGGAPARLLLLQGRPIAEPVEHYGPFVMNTRAELLQAFEDYQRTQFGGWHWDRADPVHPRTQGRFARYADGRIETP